MGSDVFEMISPNVTFMGDGKDSPSPVPDERVAINNSVQSQSKGKLFLNRAVGKKAPKLGIFVLYVIVFFVLFPGMGELASQLLLCF